MNDGYRIFVKCKDCTYAKIKTATVSSSICLFKDFRREPGVERYCVLFEPNGVSRELDAAVERLNEEMGL